MKRMPDDNFLNPLKNRPGLKPRQEFKRELEAKLRGLEIKKHRYQLIKGRLLLGVAILLIIAIFSDEILNQFNFGVGESNTAVLDKNEDNSMGKVTKMEDIIKWNSSIYINHNDGTEIISGELIGMKLGAIYKKVAKNKKDLNDGEATLVEEGTMVYSVGNTENIAVKKNNQWIMYVAEENSEYISKNEAIEIAKRNAQIDIISWEAEFIKDPKLLDITELENNSNSIWKVYGTYPMGNKDIFYIDAFTGDQLATGQEEREGFGETVDDIMELKELKDHLDESTYVYNGEINLLLSEKAKIEFKNGTSIIVILSGEESSTQLDPIQIVNPKEEISVPFEFDLDSEERIHKMLGRLKLFVEMKDEQGVTIYKKEIKAFEVE